MAEEKNVSDELADDLKEAFGFEDNEERAHTSGERAAEQVVKILGTLEAGLGLTLAAWLQRIFERADGGLLSPLTWYLAVALVSVMVGLVTLAVTPILDIFQARHFGLHLAHNKNRFVLRGEMQRLQKALDEKKVALPDAIKRSDHMKLHDGRFVEDAAKAGRRADWIDTTSRWLAVVSCAALVFSFGTVSRGVFVNIHKIEHAGATPTPEQGKP